MSHTLVSRDGISFGLGGTQGQKNFREGSFNKKYLK